MYIKKKKRNDKVSKDKAEKNKKFPDIKEKEGKKSG